MNLNDNCQFERASNLSVGAFLLLMGLGFAVITMTVLPVVGFFIVLPVLGLAAVFLAAQRGKECSLRS